MERVVCFGAAGSGKRLLPAIRKDYHVLAFIDNDERKWGRVIEDIPVMPPEECLGRLRYDRVIITSQPGLCSIMSQLMGMGIPESRIISSYVEYELRARRNFLESFSMMYGSSAPEDVMTAEAGVFQGEFAKEINTCFPQRKLLLFDTFEGFDERDIQKEKCGSAVTGDYGGTAESFVMEKMQYPEKVKIYRGYFPESAAEVSGRFLFVSLDMDLYGPTVSGLEFFQDKMVENAVILVHDYFSADFPGVRDAVDTFMRDAARPGIRCYPIGDGLSVMLNGF